MGEKNRLRVCLLVLYTILSVWSAYRTTVNVTEHYQCIEDEHGPLQRLLVWLELMEIIPKCPSTSTVVMSIGWDVLFLLVVCAACEAGRIIGNIFTANQNVSREEREPTEELYLSNVPPSSISSSIWPFRFCDVIKVDSCEEVVGDDVWNTIASTNNDQECNNTWNCPVVRQCRNITEERSIGTVHTLARNLFHVLLMKHFDGQYLAHQGISSQPFEIYIAPGEYVKYKPRIDVCLFDPLDTRILFLNIIQAGSKRTILDCMHQTMFSTLSGSSATAYCFVIKASSECKFQVYLGKVCWPRRMKQMLMICGSDISRQLGFNYQKHNQPIDAKYCCIGEISLTEDDSPTVTTFLNTIHVLSLLREELFLPMSVENSEIVEKRKFTGKHFAKCVFNETEICNGRFYECSFKDDT